MGVIKVSRVPARSGLYPPLLLTIEVKLFNEADSQFLPVIQIEIEPVNRKAIGDFLETFSYRAFYLSNGSLFPLTENSEEVDGDFFFVPQIKMNLVKPFIVVIND